MAIFGLIKKAQDVWGIWKALGYMLWHGYTTCTIEEQNFLPYKVGFDKPIS